MRHKKKSRLAAAEFLAVLIVTAVVFTKGLSAALAWRGYKAVGGEFMLLLLPIIYYEAKRIILDFMADFVELYYNSMLDVLDLAYMTVNHEKIPPNVLKEWVKLITDELSQISKIKRSDKARA